MNEYKYHGEKSWPETEEKEVKLLGSHQKIKVSMPKDPVRYCNDRYDNWENPFFY